MTNTPTLTTSPSGATVSPPTPATAGSGSGDQSSLLSQPPVTAPVIDPAADAAVRANDRGHVFHSWSDQDAINPVPIAGGSGSRFFDYEGHSYFDFGSQLVNLNLGHSHPDLIAAIGQQAARLATVQPAFANDVRGELARLITEKAGPDFSHVFFTNGGTEAVEHAVRMARVHTGRHKLLSAYRSYHGATGGAIALTGDPRRWGAEPTISGAVKFYGPYLYRSPFYAQTPEEESARALAHLRDTIMFEGPHTIAAIIIESVVGTNGILVPPPGYLAGVRSLCDEFGIVYIADEVMVGFGRLGEWFGWQAFDTRPDLITFAKGVNSGYVPLGGVVMSSNIVDTFRGKAFPGGLTYSGHPLGCAAGLATMHVFDRDGILQHVRDLGSRTIGPALAGIAAKHPSVGEIRGMGAFWAIELVKDPSTRQPLVPFNAAGPAMGPMNEFAAACKANGVWPLIATNRIHIAPPLISTASEIREALDVIDSALDLTDKYVS